MSINNAGLGRVTIVAGAVTTGGTAKLLSNTGVAAYPIMAIGCGIIVLAAFMFFRFHANKENSKK